MERIPVQEARRNFDDMVRLVSEARQRFLVQEYNKDLLGIIPTEDLALLEGLEGDRNGEVQRLSSVEVLRHLNEDLGFLADGTSWFVVHDDGKDLAALVPHKDVEMLEGLDDRIDLEAAKRLLDGELPDEP